MTARGRVLRHDLRCAHARASAPQIEQTEGIDGQTDIHTDRRTKTHAPTMSTRINSYTCARACRLRKEKRRKEEEAEEKKGGEKMVENEMDKSADENRDVGTNGRWWGAAPTC